MVFLLKLFNVYIFSAFYFFGNAAKSTLWPGDSRVVFLVSRPNARLVALASRSLRWTRGESQSLRSHEVGD